MIHVHDVIIKILISIDINLKGESTLNVHSNYLNKHFS